MDGGKELILSERLLAIAQWIPPGSRVADIGTDHGYLPIWLLQHGCAAFIAACDVREGPLEHARRSAAQYGLQEKLSFRLGSGLSCVAPDEIDTIVIAGMGGETILSILEAAPWTNDARYTLLLQPMTKAEVLRTWLSEQGYVFLKERLVLENRTYFPIMALRGGGTGQPLSIGQAWGGVALQDDPLQGNALDALLHLCTYALNGLERSTVPKNLERAAQQRAILVQLRRMKEEWLHANGKRT